LTDTPFPHPEADTEFPKLEIYNESDRSIPLSDEDHLALLRQVEQHDEGTFLQVELVYVTPERIVEINNEFLGRDYVTDIISFRYDDLEEDHTAVEGTLYCCADRIAEQAAEWEASETDEFRRVFVHGLLHLLDYEDQSDEEREAMRNRENYYLSL
jgi:probable rRNA maturation factor